MSKVYGTSNVAVTEDPETLKAELEQARAKAKELESNIGRQNDKHGRRVKELEARVREAERVIREATLAQMDPVQRKEYENRELKAELEEVNQERELRRLKDAASQKGMPVSEMDESSVDAFLIAFNEWDEARIKAENEALRQRVKELEKVEDGPRPGPIRTGSPATVGQQDIQVEGQVKLTKDQAILVDQFQKIATKAKKGNTEARASLFVLMDKLAREGIEIGWDPE